MREFTDAAGYSWAIDFTLDPAARGRVARYAGADPVDAVASEPALSAFLLCGMEAMADAVTAAVSPQARADRLDPDGFQARLGGRELWAAVEALVAAAADAAPWSPTAGAVRSDFWAVFLRLERDHLAAGRPPRWPFLGRDFEARAGAVLARRDQREGGAG